MTHSLEKLVELMSINPAKRFGIENRGYTVFDLEAEYDINPDDFLSKGKNTPFTGFKVNGECKLTVVDGKKVYEA